MMHYKTQWKILSLILLLLIISLLPAHPAAYGKIAFVSTRDEGWEIYVMDGDGGNVRRITNNTVNEGMHIGELLNSKCI